MAPRIMAMSLVKREISPQVGAHQATEQVDLQVGKDALADPGHDQGLGVGRPPLDERGEHHRQRHEIEQGVVAAYEDVVEHGLHQPGVGRGGGGREPHGDDTQHDPAKMRPDVVEQQPADQDARRRRRSGVRGQAIVSVCGFTPEV
jgi:hypothetical protein